MKECCNNCSLSYGIEKWDYRKVRTDKIWKFPQEGHLCMLFANESRKGIWMCGTDPDTELCECFTPREE